MVILSKIGSKNTKRGGGIITAVLFWLSLIIISILAFILTDIFIKPKDSLMFLAPKNAEFYVHTSVKYNDLTAKIFPELSGLQPNETSLFAVKNENETQWTALLNWSWPNKPSLTELSVLNRLKAEKINPRTFVYGAVANIAQTTDSTLIKDGLVKKSLSAIGHMNKTQGYFALSNSVPVNKAYFGISNWQSNKAIYTIFNQAENTSWLGYSLTENMNKENLPKLSAGNIAISANGSLFNPAFLLLNDIETERQRLNVPNTPQLLKAQEKIHKLFDNPLSLSVSIKKVNDRNQLSYAIYLENEVISNVQNTIIDYLNLALPSTKKFELPDKTIKKEFIAENTYFYNKFEDVSIQAISSTENINLSFPTTSFEDGVIIASDATKLHEMMIGINIYDDQRCINYPGEIIRIDNKVELFDYFPYFNEIFSINKLPNIFIQNIVDKYIVFCG